MLMKLFQVLLVPKRARAKLAADRHPPARQAPQTAGGGREQLLKDAMALYRRQRRDVYDPLDDATKRQIQEDAEKAFGKFLHS